MSLLQLGDLELVGDGLVGQSGDLGVSTGELLLHQHTALGTMPIIRPPRLDPRLWLRRELHLIQLSLFLLQGEPQLRDLVIQPRDLVLGLLHSLLRGLPVLLEGLQGD